MTKSEESFGASFDLVVNEIVEQLRAGSNPSLNEFLRRYPANASAIRELFPAIIIMAEQLTI